MSNQTFANATIPLYVSSQGTDVVQFNENITPPIGYVNKELLYCMDDHKLYYNGREVTVDLIDHLTFTPVAANPGGVDTLWVSSIDGNLYFGSISISGIVTSNTAVTQTGELVAFANTGGTTITNSSIVCQTPSGVNSMYLTKTPFANISTATRNLVITPDIVVRPDITGVSNTIIGSGAGDDLTSGGVNTIIGSASGGALSTQNSNTIIGANCASTTVSSSNTIIGSNCCSNATGSVVAIGPFALASSTSNLNSIAIGADCANGATTCTNSVAIGHNTLRVANNTSNTVAIGHNAGYTAGPHTVENCTIIGSDAVSGVTVDASNTIVIGYNSGNLIITNDNDIYINNVGASGENDTIRIGATQTKNFQAGIRGITTGVADAIPVLVDSNGQLGTVSSSIRFKENVRNLGDTSFLYRLQPRLFNYKTQPDVNSVGLIAEEVYGIYPDMCIWEGSELLTVDYQRLPIIMLNEIKKIRQELININIELEVLKMK